MGIFSVRVLRRNAPSEHIYRENASFPVNKNPRNLSIARIVWRRRRDLNSRADFSTYSLSRGAPSPAWVRLHVKLCSCRSISCPLFPQKNLAERVGFIFCGKSTAVAICHRHIAKSRLSNPWLTQFLTWRNGWDSNPRALSDKRFSRPPRYDRFDTVPCLAR